MKYENIAIRPQKSAKMANFGRDFQALPDGIFQMLKNEIKEELFNFILS